MATVAKPRATSWHGVAVVCAGLTAIWGCGRGDAIPVAKVSGKVTYQGQPVTIGMILFQPQRGPIATAALDEDGSYRLSTRGDGDGAVVGSHVVYFQPPDLPSPGKTAEGFYKPRPEPPQVLPDKYLNPRTSGLTAKVKPGHNVFDYELRP